MDILALIILLCCLTGIAVQWQAIKDENDIWIDL